MTLLTVAFGDDPRFTALLREWLTLAGDHWVGPVHVAADHPHPSASILVRNSGECRPFERKTEILLSFLAQEPGPVLYLDADALLQRNPQDILAGYVGQTLAMGTDPGKAMVGHIPMRNAGVLWFGGNHEEAHNAYRLAYADLPDHWLREQHAWTLAFHRLGGRPLPCGMNWGARCWGNDPRAHVVHWHGDSKWSRQTLTINRNRLPNPEDIR